MYVNLAALSEIDLPLEFGNRFPCYGPVTLSVAADRASDADDVGVDAGQFVQVSKL